MSFEIIISRTAVVLSCGLIVDGMTIFFVDDSIKMRMFSFFGFVCIHIGGGGRVDLNKHKKGSSKIFITNSKI